MCICLPRLSECLSRILSQLKAKIGVSQAHNRPTPSSLRVDYDDRVYLTSYVVESEVFLFKGSATGL